MDHYTHFHTSHQNAAVRLLLFFFAVSFTSLFALGANAQAGSTQVIVVPAQPQVQGQVHVQAQVPQPQVQVQTQPVPSQPQVVYVQQQPQQVQQQPQVVYVQQQPPQQQVVYAQPQPVAPPPPEEPPAPSYTYSRYDLPGWYIGISLGGGVGTLKIGDGDFFEEKGGGAFAFRVGSVVSPDLLVGYEAYVWVYGEDDSNFERTLAFHHHDIMATFFPLHDFGLYGKGGLGLAATTYEIRNKNNDQTAEAEDYGLSMRLGLGAEFQLGSAFNLGLEAVYGLGYFPGDEEELDYESHDFSVMASLNWY